MLYNAAYSTADRSAARRSAVSQGMARAFFVALDAAAGSGTGPASTGYDRCVNHQRAVGLGILVAALIATSNAFAPSSAMASPRTTPAPGVTCDGLSCDNTNNSDITIHGQMRCNGTGFESFTGVARAHTVTQFPNPNCSNGRPGVDAFFPDR
jgi:hypothetical protein